MTAAIQHNCKEELRSVSLKATPARLGVLEILELSDKPLDVSAINQYLIKNHIDVDNATVFRIVNMFKEKGLIRQINLNEAKSRYELSSRKEHHHLICQKCGEIEDISDCNIDVLEAYIEKKKKFIVKSHSLEFYGLCKNCQK